MTLIIILVVIVIIILLFVSIYNKLVALRNRWKNGFAQIDVQLKRRYDLIPNLVETAKAYLKHEKETLENVVKARNQAITANNNAATNPNDSSKIKELIGTEGVLSGAMNKLLAVFEQYPDLKANQTIAQLMEELSSTENKVSFARQAYNDAVMQYNTACETFPSLLIAKPFGFTEAVLFEIKNEEEREAVKVKF
ncbi:MAG: LemA family protein [Lentisphaerota bacterium]